MSSFVVRWTTEYLMNLCRCYFFAFFVTITRQSALKYAHQPYLSLRKARMHCMKMACTPNVREIIRKCMIWIRHLQYIFDFIIRMNNKRLWQCTSKWYEIYEKGSMKACSSTSVPHFPIPVFLSKIFIYSSWAFHLHHFHCCFFWIKRWRWCMHQFSIARSSSIELQMYSMQT